MSIGSIGSDFSTWQTQRSGATNSGSATASSGSNFFQALSGALAATLTSLGDTASSSTGNPANAASAGAQAAANQALIGAHHRHHHHRMGSSLSAQQQSASSQPAENILAPNGSKNTVAPQTVILA